MDVETSWNLKHGTDGLICFFCSVSSTNLIDIISAKYALCPSLHSHQPHCLCVSERCVRFEGEQLLCVQMVVLCSVSDYI